MVFIFFPEHRRGMFQMSNPAITAYDVTHCLQVGDRQEIQVFTGLMSERRSVAVLFNRDDIKVSV